MDNMVMNLRTATVKSQEYEAFKQMVLFHEDIEGVENKVINIYPELQYEIFEGFGGAITDACAYVYSKMNEEQKKNVIEKYFSPEQMKYGLVRIHMDSCDFSVDQYEALSDPEDEKLEGFSFERTEKYIMPMLEDANRAAGGNLKLMLSPWSPPAFMKTNGKRSLGGSLKPEYRERWAEYICRYIYEFEKRGYKVQRISLQNEPKAVQTWDSCVYTAEEEKIFLRDYMYPAMCRHGYEEIEIFIWDHNKERIYERMRDIVDEDTAHMVAGAAFHWYSGDHFELLNVLRNMYPDKKLILSESCLEYRCFDKESIQNNAGRLAHEIIGDLNHGMCAFYDWNILLDETGGPNHVGNYCHAPFLYDMEKKQLMPQKTLEYFYHFSHYIVPSSVRIATSRYTDQLETVAYRTPDQKIVMVILNRSSEVCPVSVRMNHQVAEVVIQADSITTCVIDGLK